MDSHRLSGLYHSPLIEASGVHTAKERKEKEDVCVCVLISPPVLNMPSKHNVAIDNDWGICTVSLIREMHIITQSNIIL